jgi:hypothetical protein
MTTSVQVVAVRLAIAFPVLVPALFLAAASAQTEAPCGVASGFGKLRQWLHEVLPGASFGELICDTPVA